MARARTRPSRGRVGPPPRPPRSTASCTFRIGRSRPVGASPWRSSRSTATTWWGPSPVAERRPSSAGLASQLARWISTVGGLGYAPLAPGSVTSLPVALAVWWFQPGDAVLLGVTGVVTAIGIWAASREETRLGTKDPQAIVIDEVAGMLIACAGHPRTLPWVLGLFLAFRVFDVVKPFGIDRLQALPGGFGVVVDDLLAGVYASLLGHLRHLV